MATNFTTVDYLLKKQKQTHAVSHGKESEPFGPAKDFELQEVVEHEPEPEVVSHVDVRPETLKLSQDLKKMGIQEVNSTKFPNYQNIKLPLSDEKVYNGLQAPINSSLRWLSTFALYLLQQGHLTLKRVHGKVIRIVKV